MDTSFDDYYVLDKDLNLLLDDLEVFYYTGPELAHTRQYTIFGDSEKFIYKKDGKYYMYDINRNKTVSEYNDYDDLLNNQNEFVETCQEVYANLYEYRSGVESYNGVFIQYSAENDTYLLTDKDSQTIFKPDSDITGLTYLKGKIIQGVSKSTGKTVVIFDKNFK